MISTQLPLLLRRQLATLEAIFIQLLRNRSLLFSMALGELVWLALIVATGASTMYDTILVVAVFSVVATLSVMILPASALPALRDLKGMLIRRERRALFFLCLAALVIGLIYTFRPSGGEDEISSLRAAQIVGSGGIAAAYHRVGWLAEQHPPLFSLLFALTIKLPGPDLVLMRIVSVFFLAGTLPVIYLLGGELMDRETGYLAALLFLSFPLAIRLGTAAIMDIQVAFFFALSVLLLVRLTKKPSYRLACTAGVVIGLGLLTKYMMLLVFVVLVLCVLFLPVFRTVKPYLFVVTVVSLSIFASWLLYANQAGVLNRQIQKIRNFMGIYHVVRDLRGALPSGPPPVTTEEEKTDPLEQMQSGILRLGLESLSTRLPSALGVYNAPLILLGTLYLVKKRAAVDRLLLFWLAGVSACLFLTLPDHRYFLAVFPAIAIAMAQLLLRFPDHAERAVLLSLLFGVGNLYLFASWVRESYLFIVIP